MPTRTASRAAPVLLVAGVALYLLMPGHPLGLLRGVSLDWLGVAALFGAGTLLWGFGLPHWRRSSLLAGLVLALIAAKLVLWLAAPTYGLAASYYARARLAGTPERSTEQRGGPYTRVEASPGRDGFALHFFNDVDRFNYYEAPDPDRKALPFAVRWDGYLHVPADGAYPLALTARGVAALSLDGAPVLTVGSRDAETTDQATVPLTRGAHALRLDFTHQGGDSPSLALATGLESGQGRGLTALSPPLVTVAEMQHDALVRDRLLGWLAAALDVLVLVGLLTGAGLMVVARVRAARAPDVPSVGGSLAIWERPVLAGLLLVVLAYSLVTTADLAGRAVILEGGQDWLTYESYARDILLNGPLMTLGEPLGKGKPFFFQPFYPYYLAGMHWLTGEGLWGPIVLQLFGVGVAGVLTYWLGKRLFGTVAGVLAVCLFLVLALSQLDWIARKLLSENLYFYVLPAAILLVVRAIDERRLRDVALAGLLLGVASITRAPTLLIVPGAALFIALAWWRAGLPWRQAATAFVLLGATTALVAAVVPLRNYIVSGKPSLVASNGGATLLLAHQPTDQVRLRGIDDNPVYDALNLDRATREVVEFARQDPAGYIWTLVPLGLYSVGISGMVEDNPPLAPDVLAITLLYVLAVAFLPGARSLRTWPLHLFVVIHLAIMMTFLPYVYGYRQVLPMQVLMLPFGGLFLARVLGRLGVGRRAVPTQHQPVMEQRPA
jgi:hypothetical protein